MEFLIRFRNYSFSYDGKTPILRNINLTIQPGEFVVLTGLSGCGKTTLTRVLNGLCPNFYPGTVEGTYELYGKDANKMSISELSAYWGSVFQDPRSQFLAKRVRDEVVLAMENACRDRGYMNDKLEEVVEELEMKALLGREMTVLSSGEKQKVAIGSVFCTEPNGFVLDEPSANLDHFATNSLAEFLKNAKERGHTVIISEHRLHYLRRWMDRLIIMRNGEIIREYSSDEIHGLSDSDLRNWGLRSFQVPEITVGKNVGGERSSVFCQGVGYQQEYERILRGINLQLESGKVHVLVGENGAGKSSLCKIITGLYKQTEGTVLFHGVQATRKERLRKTFFVGQDVDYQLYGYSIQNEFRIGNRKVSDEEIKNCLEEIGLHISPELNPQVLSGGQKQRLLIGLASLSGRDILVFDEPTSGLDGFHMRIIADLMRRLAENGKTVLIITHDSEFIAEVADTMIYMYQGQLKYHKYFVREES